MFQKFIFILILIGFSFCAKSQSFFKPLSKPKGPVGKQGVVKATATPDITAFRPVVNVASYLIGSSENALLSGGGISYQKLTFNETTGKWSSVWSINALAWGKVALNGTPDTKNFLYGLAVGFFNNLVLVGAATDGKKFYPTAGFGISLNN